MVGVFKESKSHFKSEIKSSSIFLKTGSFLQQLLLLFLEILSGKYKVLPLDKERLSRLSIIFFVHSLPA